MSAGEIIGFISAILIGLVMGLTGGGGSILSLPVLRYFFGMDPVTATGYSLFIVGVSAVVGSSAYIAEKQVNYRAAVFFALPSLVTTFLIRKFVINALPFVFFDIGNFEFTKDLFIMIFFGSVMLFAGFKMVKGRKQTDADESRKAKETDESKPVISLIIQGVLIGVLTGFVGAGGGFLIVPALVLMVRLPMKTAIGTSLLVVSVNTLIGFLGDVMEQEIDWSFLLVFTLISMAGIFLGARLSRRVKGDMLRKYFGWFIIMMAIAIIVLETI